MKNEDWVDDPKKFCEERGVRYVDSPDALSPVAEVYTTLREQGIQVPTVQDFIDRLNSHFDRSDRMARIRSQGEILSTSPGRGMDALSKFLLGIGVDANKYEIVMRKAHRGYLDDHYRKVRDTLS